MSSRTAPRPAMRSRTLCRYTSDADQLHDPGDATMYNESAYLNFVAHGAGEILGGVARVGLRPNQGYAEFFLLLALADGSTLYWSGREDLRRAAFEVGTPVWRTSALTLTATDPGREWRLEYASTDTRRIADPKRLGSLGSALKASPSVDCRLELTFRAVSPMHVMQESGDMIPGEAAAKDHYEQFGFVDGTLTLDGRRSDVTAAPAFRDHSWGPRDYVSAMSNMDWFTLQLDDGSNYVGYRIHSRPDLPVQGVRVDTRGAAYLDDVLVEANWTGVGAMYSPISLDLELGGEWLSATAEVVRAVMVKHRSPDAVVHNTFGLIHVDAGGRRGAGWLDLNRPAPQLPA